MAILKATPFFWYNKSLLSKIISYFLWPLTLFYRIIITMRRICYHCGLMRVRRLPVPVIVVGNITIGGTGKTPLVIWLVNFLRLHGLKPGVVSRGYGRMSRGVRNVYASSLSAEVGDEAVVIVKHTGCSMVVGENRVAAAQKLLVDNGCNIIISDDGLQHYALKRDVEIVVQDGERKWGNGLCFPAGPLREPVSRLQVVDFIIKNFNIKNTESTNSAAVFYTMQFVPECFCQIRDMNKQQELKVFLSDLQGKTCHAVAGIGNPGRFFSQLRDLGLSIQEHIFPDHHVYTAQDFSFLGGETVIMTEKDAVKCQSLAKDNWWFLRIEADPDDKFIKDFTDKLSKLPMVRIRTMHNKPLQ